MTRLNPQSSNRNILLIGTVIAAVLIALVVFAVRPAGSASSTGTKTFDLSGQPLLGQASAKVTLVVFEDYKCPNCKNFQTGTLPAIQSKYIDTGKAKLYTINFPFIGPDSTTAAQAAECVYLQKGDAGYNQMSTLLFRAQGDEKTQWANAAKMEELIGYIDGVNAATFKTCLDTNATKAKVDADTAQANRAGINSTPSIFVNGTPVEYTGPEATIPTLSAAIDKALTQ